MFETPADYNRQIVVGVDLTLGYEYFCDKEHPLASIDGKVYYHRHVASIKLGRWLLPEEVVHHLDENRANNELGNLVVFESNRAHALQHSVDRGDACSMVKECPCGKPFRGRRKRMYCSPACAAIFTRHFHVPEDELRQLVLTLPTTEIARRYGVSDTAVARRCKLYGIPKPPRGYWTGRSTKLPEGGTMRA